MTHAVAATNWLWPPTPCAVLGPGWFVVPCSPRYSYRASDGAVARNTASRIARFGVGCSITPQRKPGGYAGYRLRGARGVTNVHRATLVCWHQHGNRPTPAHVLRHIDGDASNDDHTNLAWGTTQENIADKMRHETAPRGESHYLSALTEADVRDIRSDSRTLRTIAKAYGLAPSTISNIKTRRTWKHIKK